MLTSLDPHSSFLDTENFSDMQVQTKGKFGGLGIEITMENGTLTVSGKQIKKADGSDEEADGYEYLHRGLSRRNFERTFNLAEYVEVKDASLNNGILSIHLQKIVPEAMKPKTIEIK